MCMQSHLKMYCCSSLNEKSRGLQRVTPCYYYTDNSDYVPLSEVVIGFPAEPSVMKGDSVCQTITIIGDDIMEGNESFTVIMTPVNDLDDIIGSTSVTILILLDEDGKIFYQLAHSHTTCMGSNFTLMQKLRKRVCLNLHETYSMDHRVLHTLNDYVNEYILLLFFYRGSCMSTVSGTSER